MPRRPIAEPTAAALTAATGEEEQTIAVYDLGGGTFDISIIEAAYGIYDVKWVAGDMGRWRRLRPSAPDHCIAHFLERNGVDLSNDPIALMRIQDAVKAATMIATAATNPNRYRTVTTHPGA
jgi:molecular chaperone DnaK